MSVFACAAHRLSVGRRDGLNPLCKRPLRQKVNLLPRRLRRFDPFGGFKLQLAARHQAEGKTAATISSRARWAGTERAKKHLSNNAFASAGRFCTSSNWQAIRGFT